jgi:hypothetical protein
VVGRRMSALGGKADVAGFMSIRPKAPHARVLAPLAMAVGNESSQFPNLRSSRNYKT